MTHKTTCTLTVLVASLITNVAAQQSVYRNLFTRSDVSLFRDALHFAGFDESSLLADPTQTLTLFAPTNEAILRDAAVSTYLDQPGWSVHLQQLCELHMVVGDAVPRGALFSVDGMLDTTQGSLAISAENQTIEGLSILEGNSIFGTNGIIHIMDGVFKNEWKGIALSDRTAAFASSSLNAVIEAAGYEKELDKFLDFGTTFVATANDFSEEGGNIAIFKALMNESATGEAQTTLLYNTINVNLYEDLLKSGLNLHFLATPRGGEAQMWVTRDEEGNIRFNDAVADGFEMAENGVFYVVDRLLSPPGIIEFLGLTATYGDLDVSNAYELFKASSWNSSNLVKSLGIQKDKLTLFAPTDAFLKSLPTEEIDRLLNPLWSRHLDDLLMHWLTDKSYTDAALQEVATFAGGAFELTMLSGSTVSVVAESDGGLSITDGLSPGPFLKPHNMRGVDGLIHVVDTVLLPPSFRYSVLQQATNDPHLFVLASLIGEEQLISDISPMTLFAPEDRAFQGKEPPTAETTDLIQDHIFEGLLFASTLRQMDGQTITSINNVEFLITVDDDTVTLGRAGAKANATIVAADILGKTGVMHRIDGILTASPLHPMADILTEGQTITPTIEASTVVPDQTFTPTEQMATETTTMAPTEALTQNQAATDAPTQLASQSGTMAATEVDGTTVPLTDSPSGEILQSIEPTHDADSMTEATSHVDDASPGASETSPQTVDNEEEQKSGISTQPSSSPTQLVQVLADPEDSRQGSLSTDNDSLTEGQTASATSSGRRQYSIYPRDPITPWTASFIAVSVSLAIS